MREITERKKWMRIKIYPILWQGRETHKPNRLSGTVVTISDTVVTK